MNKKLLVGLAAIILLVSSPTSLVLASTSGRETTNDLFELYNKEELEGTKELQNEYTEAKVEYDSKKSEIEAAESFNNMYKSAQEYQNEKKAGIDLQVSELMDKNEGITNTIEDSLDAEWKDLVQLDAQYKTNLVQVNNLLVEKSKYMLTEKQEVNYDELDELEVEVVKVEDKYQESSDSNNLGEVAKLKFPLSKDTVITSQYGDRVDPMSKSTVRFHSGIDLKASVGTEVLSLFNGTVIATGYGPLGGYFISIDHGNGVTSYYCHLSEIKCQVGDKLEQYGVIALSGNSGTRTTGPHLHLGLYIDGNSVDPGVLFK